MGVLSNIARLLLPQREDYQLQLGQADLFGDADLPVEEQLRRRLQRAPSRSYRLATAEEALGVPSIMGAVSLIAATVGTLDLEAWKNSVLVTDRLDVPRLIGRPNPLTKPFDFYRDTAFHLASRGEFWWAIVSRDSDGNAAALYPVPPWQIRVEANLQNPLRPRIFWNEKLQRNEDLVHHMYLPDLSGLRGVGPLQIGRAAASVAVEADAWAANFFSGALPSLTGTTDADLDPNDLKKLDAQWLEKDGNIPRWFTNGMKLNDPPYDAQKAQLTESRQHQVGEVARLFNMPGSLLEYNMPGASLRYQNDEQVWTDFQRRCLSPHYLEPIEQAMGDLLPRSVAVRFNLDQLLRSDAKTRAEIYNLTVPLGIDTVDEARQREGKAPGNVNFMPVPPAPPAAIPTSIPLQLSRLEEVRCPKGHLLGKSDGNTEIKCHRCGQMGVQTVAEVASTTPVDRVGDALIALANREPQASQVSVNVPATPVELRVETPESQQRAAALVEQAEANVQAVGRVFESHIEKLTDVLEKRISEVAEAATRPRTLVPERDATGRIVSVTQH